MPRSSKPNKPPKRISREEVESKDEDIEIDSTLPVVAEPKEPTAAGPGISDTLKRYLSDLRKYPLLDPEEELALAQRLVQTGDMDAARRLVTANLRLVVKIAFEYQSVYSNLLDLIQEGNIGLMKAVSKFDPSKNVRLAYYASWWIRSYILKYLLDNFRLVRVGTTQAQKKLFYHLMREKQRLEAQGIVVGPKLLAEKLDVKESEVVEMENRLSSSGSEVPLDAPVGRDSDSASRPRTVAETISAAQGAADEDLAMNEWLDILKEKLPEFEPLLNDKEKVVMKERLLAEEPKTLQEIADQYELTRERVRQIEARIIEKLRKFLSPYLENEH